MQGLKHPATIIASLALFVALSSGAALASGLISGKKIVNHSIPEKKLTAAAIKALRGLQGPRGATGASGSRGPKGDTGPIGPSSATSTYASSPVAFGTSGTIATLALSAGSYFVIGNTTLVNYTAQDNVICRLKDSQAGELDLVNTYTDYPNFPAVPLSLVAPLQSSGSTVTIVCVGGGQTSAYNTHLAAIKLGSVSGS